MVPHGIPDEVLTDNGKVFTGRFGRTAEVLFDRICRENGISHRLTAPGSPTTTGKIERFHQTVRKEFLPTEHSESSDVAQSEFDAWVHDYNNDRPHQALEMSMPAEAFGLVARDEGCDPRSRSESGRPGRPMGPQTGRLQRGRSRWTTRCSQSETLKGDMVDAFVDDTTSRSGARTTRSRPSPV